MAGRKPTPPPFLPFEWDKNLPAVMAIQALDRGVATPEQQRLAMTTIIEGLCMYYDLSYRDTDRDTAFAEGRRFVGGQLVKLTKIPVGRVSDISKHRERP